MRHPFLFKADKSVEAILYIAQHVVQPTFHRISKVMYFADKVHLEKYGRFICGDSYVAMKHGPVPMYSYEILKTVRGDGFAPCSKETDVKSAEKTKKAFIVVDEFLVKPLRAAQLDYFSESDLECLDKAIDKYGRMSSSQLTELSHDKAWQAADENGPIDIEQIVATLTNTENLLDLLHEPCPG
jgi:uncharacterized phage-associated protein